MVSHHNVISNVLQASMAENAGRNQAGGPSQTALGLLPLSHIYGLTIIAHTCMFVGDEVIILPKFELDQMLAVIDKYGINMLYLVSPLTPLTSNPLLYRYFLHVFDSYLLTSRLQGPAHHCADIEQYQNPSKV